MLRDNTKDIESLNAKIENLESRLFHLEVFCAELYHSRQNRFYKLMRTIRSRLLWFFQGTKAWLTFKSGSRPRRTLKYLLIRSNTYTLKKPKLRKMLLAILRHFPYLEQRIKWMLITQTMMAATHNSGKSTLQESVLQQLTPEAQRIYYLFTMTQQKGH